MVLCPLKPFLKQALLMSKYSIAFHILGLLGPQDHAHLITCKCLPKSMVGFSSVSDHVSFSQLQTKLPIVSRHGTIYLRAKPGQNMMASLAQLVHSILHKTSFRITHSYQ